jgi:radical SAM superfamily enzyme YgiQ (UPF0313 family)
MGSEGACDVALIHPPHLLHEERYHIFPLPWNLYHVGSSPLVGRYPLDPEWTIEPIGFYFIKHFVENNSKHVVDIINLAELKFDSDIMLNNIEGLEEEKQQLQELIETEDISLYADIINRLYPKQMAKVIEGIKADLYAVDLHWLVYSQGAIRTLELIKQIHPESYTLVGGMTASYFKDEIMERFKHIDFLIYGDGSVPFLALLNEIKGSKDYSKVPNLLYRAEGEVRRGPRVPLNDYDYIESHSDFLTTSIQTARGCPLQCIVCGGSESSSRSLQNYSEISVYSVESLLEKMYYLTGNNSRHANIFLIHDPILTLGKTKWNTLLDEIKKSNLKVSLDIEFFMPHAEEDIRRIADSAPGSSIHISPESINEGVRNYHKNLRYSNDQLIMNMDAINECDDLSMEIWFMAGLAKDTRESIDQTLDFIKEYYKRIGDIEKNIIKYSEMLFIDPGSLAYDAPEKYGYELIHKDFASHMNGFLMPIFKYQINYCTPALSRDSLYDVFLYLHDKMNEVYYKNKILDKTHYDRITSYNQMLRKYEGEYAKASVCNDRRERDERFRGIGMRLRDDLK